MTESSRASISGLLGTSCRIPNANSAIWIIHSSLHLFGYVSIAHTVENMSYSFNERESPVWRSSVTAAAYTARCIWLFIMANNESQLKDILSHCLTMRMLDSNVLLIELTDISFAYSTTTSLTDDGCKKKIQIRCVAPFFAVFLFLFFSGKNSLVCVVIATAQKKTQLAK